jgi:hypothetical protein
MGRELPVVVYVILAWPRVEGFARTRARVSNPSSFLFLTFPLSPHCLNDILRLMNEQPQQNDLQHEGKEPVFHEDGAQPSSYSGFELAHASQPVQAGLPAEPHQPHPEPVHVSWEASEYIHHTKSFMWFVGYAALMLVLLAIAYFFTHSWTFVVLVVVMAVAVGVFATRPPRMLHYSLTDTGIQIENADYHYSDFRAFGVINDGALFSIMLIPTKRFMPAVNIYFEEADGEKIVDVLGARLPMQDLHLDVVDRLVRRLRF